MLLCCDIGSRGHNHKNLFHRDLQLFHGMVEVRTTFLKVDTAEVGGVSPGCVVTIIQVTERS